MVGKVQLKVAGGAKGAAVVAGDAAAAAAAEEAAGRDAEECAADDVEVAAEEEAEVAASLATASFGFCGFEAGAVFFGGGGAKRESGCRSPKGESKPAVLLRYHRVPRLTAGLASGSMPMHG